MIEKILKIIVRFIVLILLQVLVLNNIQLGGYINPYLYILFIMMLPLEIPGWFLLVLAFILGLCIDVFTNTIGMHISATLFMAFCRPFILKVIAPRDGYEVDQVPTIQNLGLSWFLTYAVFLTFMHHLVLFYVEVFRFREFFSTLLRVILSSGVTIILILLSQYLFYKPRTT